MQLLVALDLGVLTTVLGVVPLLWDPFFKSLAVVIICGLSFCDKPNIDYRPNPTCYFFQGRPE